MSNQQKQVCDSQTQIPCPVCGGKRRCPICGGAKTVSCGTCHGRGKVDCPVCTRGTVSKTCWVNCEHCHGRGILIRDGSRGTCGWCGGRGQVEESYDEICPNCHGDYEEHKECRSCGGRGKKACVYCKATGKVTCPLCHDEGVISIEAICNKVIEMTESYEVEPLDGKWVKNLVVPCLTESAEHGSGSAMYALGCLYDEWERNVFPCDKEIAASWYHKAAEKGNVDAQRSYAGMLEDGEGVKQNLGKAFEWYGKAAQQGDGYSLWKVVYSYIDGHLERGDALNGTIDHGKALEGVRKIIKEWKRHTGDWWDQDEIEYATKHAELLPDIINGDGKAVSRLIKWIKNNDHNQSRRERFITYWEKVKEAAEEKKRAEERAAEAKVRAKRLRRARLRGMIEGLLLLGIASSIVFQVTENVLVDTYIAGGCSVLAVLLYLVRFGNFRLCEQRFKWRWSFVVYMIFMVLAFLYLRGYLKIPDGLAAMDSYRMLAGGSIMALVLIVYQIWPRPSRVVIECSIPLCVAAQMILRTNELTTDACIVTGCAVVAVVFYVSFYRRSSFHLWTLMERLGYIAYVLFMLLLAGWPSVRNEMVRNEMVFPEWLNVLDSTHSHVWGSLVALALIAYQANWTERMNAKIMIRVVFGICVVSLFYDGHWIIGSFWILIGMAGVMTSDMHEDEKRAIRLLPILFVGAAITGILGHWFFGMGALVGCFFYFLTELQR